MATVSHESHPESHGWAERVLVREMWASLAISVIWLAVLFDAIFGPDLVSNSATSSTTVPSAIIIVPFAYLATAVVAKYGLGRRDPG
jgi:hypothetical protein